MYMHLSHIERENLHNFSANRLIKFNDLYIIQIILQELDDVSQQVTDERSLTMFIRRWNPSQMTLGPFNEITVYGEFVVILYSFANF